MNCRLVKTDPTVSSYEPILSRLLPWKWQISAHAFNAYQPKGQGVNADIDLLYFFFFAAVRELFDSTSYIGPHLPAVSRPCRFYTCKDPPVRYFDREGGILDRSLLLSVIEPRSSGRSQSLYWLSYLASQVRKSYRRVTTEDGVRCCTSGDELSSHFSSS
jgi:hypothetical protein